MTRKYGSLMRAADAEFLRAATKHEYELSTDRYDEDVNSGGAIYACVNKCAHSGGPSDTELHDYGCDAEWIVCWVDP